MNTPVSTTLHINNEKNILHYIYNNRNATSLTLQRDLNLSRPTVAQILKDLSMLHFIYTKGLADSTGGRKASLYEFNPTIKISIGVEILIDHFELTAVDLYGEMLKFEKHSMQFSNSPDYYDNLCYIIDLFIRSLCFPPEQILNVGLALQALISPDGQKIIYGKILDCTGLSIQEFSKRLPYPCSFHHDAEARANVELWMNPFLKDAIFLNIRSDVSGSIIIDRGFFQDGAYKSGLFEHMTMIPNGRPCYCGKKGCVNAYCSLKALLLNQEDIKNFFFKVRSGSDGHRKRWQKYLEHLATAIDNFHMIINSNVIIAGTLSLYLNEEDLDYMHSIILQKTAFPTPKRYISISKYSHFPACMGAALPAVREFLESVM